MEIMKEMSTKEFENAIISSFKKYFPNSESKCEIEKSRLYMDINIYLYNRPTRGVRKDDPLSAFHFGVCNGIFSSGSFLPGDKLPKTLDLEILSQPVVKYTVFKNGVEEGKGKGRYLVNARGRRGGTPKNVLNIIDGNFKRIREAVLSMSGVHKDDEGKKVTYLANPFRNILKNF